MINKVIKLKVSPLPLAGCMINPSPPRWHSGFGNLG